MSETLDSSWNEPVTPKRPVFITVLCILTFISCGLTVLTSIYSLATVANTEQALRAASAGRTIDNLSAVSAGYGKWTLISSYLGLANCAICFAGAMMMWKLRKPGFFIYAFGQLLPFISLIGMYSVLKDVPFLGIIMLLSAIFNSLFSIAFVIMYGVNLKHMR